METLTNEQIARIDRPEQMRDFALAGNAIFTLRSTKTGKHLTYRIRVADSGDPHFVSAATGEGFEYLGVIWSGDRYVQTRKSRFDRNDVRNKAFDWFWTNLTKGADVADVEFWTEGKCGRCARPLTDPESIARGIGPVCAEAMGIL